MKIKSFFSIIVVMQSLWIATQAHAMDDSALSKSEHYARSREQRLSSFFNQIFGVDVQIKDDTVSIQGTQGQLEAASAKLNDFNELRKHVIPVSSKAITTQACTNSQFTCWQECLVSLGIQQDNLSNFAIMNQLDEDGCLKIPYGLVSGELTFNQKLANMYIEEIKRQSLYFDWVSRCNNQLIQTSNDYLIINYGLLAEYLCSLGVQAEPTDNENIFVSQFSLKGVLKRLTAAAGGDVSLVGTSKPGQYRVRTVMLGHDSYQNREGAAQNIEIVIDRSSSMDGEKINTVNKRMPIFLSQLRRSLSENQSLNVEVYAFSEDISHYNTYTLTHSDSSTIYWKNIGTGGGTDLTKVGERLKLSNPDERKVVVAFTDGEHTSSTDLSTSLSSISKMQHEGCFAQPYFCRVGLPSSDNTSYFSKVSSAFAGSFYDHDSIDEFCQKVSSKIPHLLESNVPLILTVDGIDITIRQQDAKPDIHTTTQTVSSGDAIMHRGVRGIVDVSTEIERLEAQIAALKLKENSIQKK